MMKKEKEKTFVYINTFAAHYANEGFMKRFLDKKIGKPWNAMSDVLIPRSLDDRMIKEQFFHGVATAQFSMIQDGGTFINPMIAGFKTDFDTWNDIVHKYPDFVQNVIYLDIPYSLYKVVDDGADGISEEDYNMNSDNMKKLVADLEKEFYVSTKIMH